MYVLTNTRGQLCPTAVKAVVSQCMSLPIPEDSWAPLLLKMSSVTMSLPIPEDSCAQLLLKLSVSQSQLCPTAVLTRGSCAQRSQCCALCLTAVKSVYVLTKTRGQLCPTAVKAVVSQCMSLPIPEDSCAQLLLKLSSVSACPYQDQRTAVPHCC